MQGAGLGLSIALAYAEMLNGKLYLKSEVGEGTVFYLDLLQEKYQTHQHETAEVLPSPKKTNTHSKSLNVLLAEDEETSALVISKTLKTLY